MLNVSEILRVARGEEEIARVRAASPDRYRSVSPRPQQSTDKTLNLGASAHASTRFAGLSGSTKATDSLPLAGRVSSPSIKVVVWNVCLHCNMRCPHCYAAAGKRPSNKDLSTAQGKQLLQKLAGGGVRALIFSGGEPLLRPDLLELIRYANELGLSTHLSTNGVLIDAAKAAELADAGIRYVGISIDGLPDFNDNYRGLQHGYKDAVRGLVNARKSGMRTGLRITVSKRNSEHVYPLLDTAMELGVNRFYVSHLQYSGRAKRIADEDLSPADTRALLLKLFAKADALLDTDTLTEIVTGANDSGAVLLMHWVEENYGPEAALKVQQLLRSKGGNRSGESLLCVDSEGKVHPDQFWRTRTLGDLKTQTWSEVLANPLLPQLTARAELLQGRCGACRFIDLCRGSHRERALAAGAGLWGPDPACVMHDQEIGWVEQQPALPTGANLEIRT